MAVIKTVCGYSRALTIGFDLYGDGQRYRRQQPAYMRKLTDCCCPWHKIFDQWGLRKQWRPRSKQFDHGLWCFTFCQHIVLDYRPSHIPGFLLTFCGLTWWMKPCNPEKTTDHGVTTILLHVGTGYRDKFCDFMLAYLRATPLLVKIARAVSEKKTFKITQFHTWI